MLDARKVSKKSGNRKPTQLTLYSEYCYVIADNIKDRMRFLDWDVYDLADASGVSVKTIKRILNPVRSKLYNPYFMTLFRLAYGLNMRLEDLFD